MAAAITDAHRRRISVARFEAEAEKALARDPSPLRRARLAARMTQRALSVLSGVSLDAVRRCEQGDPRVSARTLNRLANALGVSVSHIRP